MSLIEKKCDDFSGTPPAYVDFETIFAALDALRRVNTAGYGFDEPVEVEDDDDQPSSGDDSSDDDSSDDDSDETRPWPNDPFEDQDGRPLGTGEGFLLPFVVEDDQGQKRTVGEDGTTPRRTSSESATLDALAVALSRLTHDKHGVFHPTLGTKRLPASALDDWDPSSDDAPDEGAVALLPGVNLGVQIDAKQARRGDLVVIEWDPSGKHVYYCWDAHRHGDDVWLQLASSQAQTAGVGVILRAGSAAREGQYERTQRLGTVIWAPVHRADRAQPWLATREARDFYRQHAHWFRAPAKDGDSVGRVKSFWVGRFHRLFPRFPLALAGSDEVSGVVALALEGDDDVAPVARTREQSTELYFANSEHDEKGGVREGGFFPIGSGSTWHGGVHLYPGKTDDLVHAPLDGAVIAARLTGDASGAAGDAGFVLVKSRLRIDSTEQTVFTLLMHLARPDAKGPPLSWLDDILGIPAETDAGWTQGLDVAKDYARVLPVPPVPGEDSGIVTEDRTGADDPDDGGLLVFEKRDRFLASKGKVAKDAIVEVVSGVDAHGWAKVRTQSGDVEGWVFGETRLSEIDPQEYDTKRREKRKKLLAGEVVDLSDLDQRLVVRAGEVVGKVGKVAGSRAIHVEVFSKDLIPVDDKTKPDIEDTDATLHTDRKKFEDRFFDLLEQALGQKPDETPFRHYMIGDTRKDDDQVHREEIREFFAKSPLREKLRPLITRHHSCWSDSVDYKPLLSSPAYKHMAASAKQALLDEATKLQWWKGGFLASEGLPSDHLVHHYHPIHFFAWLDSKREADSSGDLHASVFELNHEDES